ncbi:MAG: class I SAM-dependent methyltransferase [Promethearchaeota archaeon]
MQKVASVFNVQKEYYDRVSDLWYSWHFSRLHAIIAENIIKRHPTEKVLDIGAGTGLQSFLYAAGGSEVYGVDIAGGLIEKALIKAQNKAQQIDFDPLQLFPSHFDYVDRYNRFINIVVQNNREKYPVKSIKQIKPPIFKIADAVDLPFDSNEFDHVNCCGSVLNFVPDYEQAISEMERVLKPNGTFVIDIDMRFNPDQFWFFIDPLLKGKIGLNNNFWQGLKLLLSPPKQNVRINFPFGNKENPINMEMNLFSKKSIIGSLLKYNLKVEHSWSIHSITNIIPSVYLDNLNPSPLLCKFFKIFAKIEERRYFFPGCSQVFIGKKI